MTLLKFHITISILSILASASLEMIRIINFLRDIQLCYSRNVRLTLVKHTYR